MKNHWVFKLIALILAMVSAAALAVSGLSVAANLNFGSYGDVALDDQVEQIISGELEGFTYEAAMTAAVKYVKEQKTDPGTVEREIWESYYNYTWHDRGIWPEYEYVIQSRDGRELASTVEEDVQYARTVSASVWVEDGIITDLGSSRKEFPLYEELPPDYAWVSYHGDDLPDLDPDTVYYELVQWGDYNRLYRVERLPDTELTVQIYMTEGDLEQLSSSTGSIILMKAAYGLRAFDIPVTVISAVVLLIAVVYLCLVSGKTTGGEVRPRGTNRMPLDLFLVLACCPAGLCLAGGTVLLESITRYVMDLTGLYWYMAGFGAFAAGLALSVTLFLMALCAQIRQGSGAWLRQTLIGRCWHGLRNLCGKLFRKILNLFNSKGLLGLLSKGGMMIRTVYHTLPLIWQWGIGLCVLILLALWATCLDNGFGFILVLLVGLPLALYGAHAFGKLRDAANRMSQGDLDTKIDVRAEFLYGNFAEFAEDLNALGDTCIDAAMAKMKSERMKSELITNVSHDIKTPLTSIINYVDLLKKADTEEQRAECLEVLERQSQRLKKLIGDLMEMSKASSGNIIPELSEGDIIEAVNQALGEFSDRMDALNLRVVFRQREESIEARFDGKLLWRVMSNLLSNVVKYALPGTRVYVDAAVSDSGVTISIKNISREPLNISADELMERFVRGDESRSDQGNGLGLNIAKSLMEVQGGSLELTVDGDLFKVTLTLD